MDQDSCIPQRESGGLGRISRLLVLHSNCLVNGLEDIFGRPEVLDERSTLLLHVICWFLPQDDGAEQLAERDGQGSDPVPMDVVDHGKVHLRRNPLKDLLIVGYDQSSLGSREALVRRGHQHRATFAEGVLKFSPGNETEHMRTVIYANGVLRGV